MGEALSESCWIHDAIRRDLGTVRALAEQVAAVKSRDVV
jgi:hypothetical protein